MTDIAASESVAKKRITWKYYIDVVVIRGIGLVKPDLGAPDPFVAVHCGNKKYNTNVMKRTLNPQWNANIQFVCKSQPKSLCIYVKDWDIFGSDGMGECEILIEPIWFENENVNTFVEDLKKATRGKINFSLICRKVLTLNEAERELLLHAIIRKLERKQTLYMHVSDEMIPLILSFVHMQR
eukprot:178923_1